MHVTSLVPRPREEEKKRPGTNCTCMHKHFRDIDHKIVCIYIYTTHETHGRATEIEYGWNIQWTGGPSQNECCCRLSPTSKIVLTYPFGNKAVVFVLKKVTNTVILSRSYRCWQTRANEPPYLGLLLDTLWEWWLPCSVVNIQTDWFWHLGLFFCLKLSSLRTCTGGKCGKYTVIFGTPTFIAVVGTCACNWYQAAVSPPPAALGTRLVTIYLDWGQTHGSHWSIPSHQWIWCPWWMMIQAE